jgi:hypothetical protein
VAALAWLKAHDAGLSALRRSARAALIAPAALAFCTEVVGNPAMATFAMFGSISLLLFTDFGGPMRERVTAQAALVLAGAVLIAIGTLGSQEVWLAALTMLVAAFAVLFAGAVSSVPSPSCGPRPRASRCGWRRRAAALLARRLRAEAECVRGHGTATAVKMIWTAGHVDAARRLKARIAGPARVAAAAVA